MNAEMKHKSFKALAWIVVSLAGCSQSSVPSTSATAPISARAVSLSESLPAYDWSLVKIIDGNNFELADWPRSFQPGQPSVQLKFDRDGHIFGQICNFITWRYSLVGGNGIKASQEVMTFAACGEAMMRLESHVALQISKVSSVRSDVDSDGTPLLILRTSDGSRLVFSGSPLKGN